MNYRIKIINEIVKTTNIDCNLLELIQIFVRKCVCWFTFHYKKKSFLHSASGQHWPHNNVCICILGYMM